MIICPECGTEEVYRDVWVQEYQPGGGSFKPAGHPFHCVNCHVFVSDKDQ